VPKQKVPDIDFDFWTIAEIPSLFSEHKIYINADYQRADIWSHQQKIELIRSINNRYSIGALVTYINDDNQFEILDGQQRLITIKQYLEDNLDLTKENIDKYSTLKVREKTLLDAYCVYYILLKSHDPQSKEEDIVQTFLRLQEGTPLNKAEKLNAQRGEFKNTFRKIRETHPIFGYLGKEKRFRWRQLAAELLSLELESDFKNKVFQSLDLPSMLNIVKKYEKDISTSKVKFFKGNLDYLHNSLNILLTALQVREIVSLYLLISYLRRTKADNRELVNEFAEFARQFMQNLNLFSIYDRKPPPGMTRKLFEKYRQYKLEAKVMTTSESIRKRFDIVLEEFKRLQTYIKKDPNRLYDTEQKRILYFRQKGLCALCSKPMNFASSSGHHVVAHFEGGKTGDLGKAVLLHHGCHRRVEKDISEGIQHIFPQY
jgi:5-methylcytosine-specific restriction endonuclease McrA